MANVTTVMTANPSCCKHDTPLKQVAQMMIDSDCGMIPVVDDAGSVIGFVSRSDILRAVVTFPPLDLWG